MPSRRLAVWAGLSLCLFSRSVHAERIEVRSPSGGVTLTLSTESDIAPLTYSVAMGDHAIVQPSPIQVKVAGHGDISQGVSIWSITDEPLDERVRVPWGKASTIRNQCGRKTASLRGGSQLDWEVELRAYDDGVALRYGFPRLAADRELQIHDESIQIRLSGNPTLLYTPLDHFATSHEVPYVRQRLSDLPTGRLMDVPLLAVWRDPLAVAVLEGRLRNFAGMYLEGNHDSGETWLRTRLSPLPAMPNSCVVWKHPGWSPWRVFLVSDRAGRLIESNLPVCLNEPPAQDYEWVQPGKSTWHWWNGTREEGLGFPTGMNRATHRHYIDFCAAHGIAYHAVVADDKPWYVQSQAGFSPGPDTDICTPRPELELPKILDYARGKGVGIRLWVHWRPLADRLDEAFATYERWGIRGLMVDFLDRNDQEMVEFNERVLQSAARHHLHIQFHGSYPPSGEQRTFPHLFNREGVLNLEYLKWGDLCTPDHNVNVAYTRLLAGPLDYHLGGFRSVPRDSFRPTNENPSVLGTRCHHLAMYVVYENPMPMVCDSPSAYDRQVGLEFLAEVPTTWDATRFVSGEPGESIVVARRHGQTWYLGGMTSGSSRSMDVPLDFLPAGSWNMTLYQDANLDGTAPNDVDKSSRVVDGGSLSIPAAPGGGFVAVLRRE